ncbi:MAG: CPBP family intramembrane glutamic endopeptidase [Candidatus Helarchaeota archaeon]
MVLLGFIIGACVLWGVLHRRKAREHVTLAIKPKIHRAYRAYRAYSAPAPSSESGATVPGVPVVSEPEEVRKSLFAKPDRFEIIMYLILLLFFIATFMNVQYLGSAVESERRVAVQYLAIAGLGAAGLSMRAVFDHIPVVDIENNVKKGGLTSTEYETKNLNGLGSSLSYFGIAFFVQIIISFVALNAPLALFTMTAQLLVMGIICAVGEEIFFSYCLTGLLAQQLKWLAIPITTAIFVMYHTVVYVETAHFTALLYVAIMRIVYSTVYLLSRRLSSVTLAHLLNNVLAGLIM